MKGPAWEKRFSFSAGRGFTLIELLIVILIISVLAAFIVKVTGVARRKAYEASARATIETLDHGAKSFYQEKGYYPGIDSPANPLDPKSNVIGTLYEKLCPEYGDIKEEDIGVLQPNGKPRRATRSQLNDPAVDKVIIDPWGESYVARENESKATKEDWMHNKQGMDIYSKGPNMKDDTAHMVEGDKNDDIGNW